VSGLLARRASSKAVLPGESPELTSGSLQLVSLSCLSGLRREPADKVAPPISVRFGREKSSVRPKSLPQLRRRNLFLAHCLSAILDAFNDSR
jgi:hypothetical protein